jgi:hypothetical protein
MTKKFKRSMRICHRKLTRHAFYLSIGNVCQNLPLNLCHLKRPSKEIYNTELKLPWILYSTESWFHYFFHKESLLIAWNTLAKLQMNLSFYVSEDKEAIINHAYTVFHTRQYLIKFYNFWLTTVELSTPAVIDSEESIYQILS